MAQVNKCSLKVCMDAMQKLDFPMAIPSRHLGDIQTVTQNGSIYALSLLA